MINLENYWEKAISFSSYIKDTEAKIAQPKNPEDIEFKAYYELALQRMERMLKVYTPSPEALALLAEKKFNGKILIISEAWCGDASQCIPVLVKLFEGKNELKIFYRDHDTSLIDKFLTNGGRAIPKVLILNNNGDLINTWGPRPAFGTALFQKYKNTPEQYSKEQFYKDLQIYYAKNKGKDTVEEILKLL